MSGTVYDSLGAARVTQSKTGDIIEELHSDKVYPPEAPGRCVCPGCKAVNFVFLGETCWECGKVIREYILVEDADPAVDTAE